MAATCALKRSFQIGVLSAIQILYSKSFTLFYYTLSIITLITHNHADSCPFYANLLPLGMPDTSTSIMTHVPSSVKSTDRECRNGSIYGA